MDDLISRQAAVETVRKAQSIGQAHRMLLQMPSAQPTCTVFVPVDDCISRQAAIDMLKNRWKKTRNYEGIGDDIAEECELYLKQVPSAQPGWIPCSERLPDVRQWVLCQCRAGIMDVLRLTADGSWNKNYPHTEYMSGFVVAWMPLPKPYREGGQDD